MSTRSRVTGFVAVATLASIGGVAAEPDGTPTQISTAGPPPTAEGRYTVQTDDTLWRIAFSHGVTLEHLMEANGIEDPNVVWVGVELVIPGPAEAPASPPPVSAAPRSLWPAHERADALLARAERKLTAARFEEALALTEEARALLAPISRTRRAQPRLAELEVSAGTVYVAMARREEAVACFQRALAADPALVLDPAATSPKILRVFRAAQSGGPVGGAE